MKAAKWVVERTGMFTKRRGKTGECHGGGVSWAGRRTLSLHLSQRSFVCNAMSEVAAHCYSCQLIDGKLVLVMCL